MYIQFGLDLWAFYKEFLMAWLMAWPINEWVERVNNLVMIDGDEVRTKANYEYEDPSCRSNGVLISRERVDLVVQGPCPTQDTQSLSNLDWLRHILDSHPEAKRVAIYAACCGGEYRRYQDFFGTTFQEISFVFIRASDLYDQPDSHCGTLVRDAIQAGIIGIAKLG